MKTQLSEAQFTSREMGLELNLQPMASFIAQLSSELWPNWYSAIP